MGNVTANRPLRISNLAAVTKSKSYAHENKEDATLIWLDKTIDTARTTLREITDYVLLYTKLEPCITYIQSVSKEQIFIIVSGEYAEQCLNQIHDLPQVDSVFVFCLSELKNQHDLCESGRFSKIVGIFDNEDDLVISIREHLQDLRKQVATFSWYEKQKSPGDSSKQSASFLWFQLFKNVLFQMSRSEETKNEMIRQCQQYYRGNIEELKNIDEFIQTYTEKDAIHWYTKSSFLYRLCNKAFRTRDVEILYIFRYYLQDLCQQLAIEHAKYVKNNVNNPLLELYRGLHVTKDELLRFQSNIGSLICMNGFLSATRNYESALEFALKTSKRSVDVLPTVFIIKANTSEDHVIFADISSRDSSVDDEILFDIGCAFKITDVFFNFSKNVWTICIDSSNEAQHIMETYIEVNKHEIERDNLLLIFGLFLTEMGQYHPAQVYFEKLLSSKMVEDKVALYTNIGRVKYLKGFYEESLKDFKIVYEMQRLEYPPNNLHLARTMNNLGLIYFEQQNYDLALDYHYNVVHMYKTNENLPEILRANSDNAIGVIFTYKQEYSRALKHLFRAMKLYEQCLPTVDHPVMATNYNSIGLVFYYAKDYDQALDYCLKALNIREKIFPSDHPHIADSCNNVALIYHHLNDFEKASSLFLRAIDIYESDDDLKMKVPICYNNVGLLYLDQQDFDQAIEYYLKAFMLYVNGNTKNIYAEQIAFTLDNLGVACEMKGDSTNALKYYKRALNCHLENPEKIVRILIKVGNIHQSKGDYNLALYYYQEALNRSEASAKDLISSVLMPMGIIYHRQRRYNLAMNSYKRALLNLKQSQLSSDLDITWIYDNIGFLYDDMGDRKRALKYLEKAYRLRQQYLPSIHPDLATSLNNLGRIHQTLAHNTDGNSIEAEKALAQYTAALQIQSKSLPNDHPDLAISYYNLASIHFEKHEYENANDEIQHSWKIQTKVLPTRHPDLKKTLSLMKEIKSSLDDYSNQSKCS